MAVSRRSIGSVFRIGAQCASLAVLLGAAVPLPAQTVSVYRCVDADGRVALQDRPCPPGQLDRRDEVRLDPNSPAPSAPPPPAADPAPPPPTPAPPSMDPPPPLWVCVDYEGQRRFSPNNDPRPRYVPYWVVAGSGIDLAGRRGRFQTTPSATPGGDRSQLLVLVEDECSQLPPGAACRAYREQRDEARRREYNSIGDPQRAAAAEMQRLDAILDRHCGG